MTTEKTIALTRWTFVGKVMSLLFNMLSRLVITFLPRSKRLLISWLQSPSAVILEPPKIKSDTVSTVSSSIYHEVMWLGAMIFIFWILSFKPTFSFSSFTFIKRLFSSSSLEEKGTTEDEMARWHHRLDGREFEWTPGVDDRQGGLACCSPWDHRESDTTEQLNWTDSLVMLSIFSCVCWPSVCFLWRNVYLILLPIFWLGSFDMELHELFVYFGD